MYKITCDGVKIYDTTSTEDSLKLTGPTLTLSDNSAGSLEFSCAPNTIAYSNCNMLTSTVSVFRDGIEIWRGRPLTSKEDFWKCRSIYCEGAMSFLVDTVLPSDVDLEGDKNIRDGKIRTTVSNFIDLILNNHNSKIGENRKIYKGICSVTNRNNVANFEYEADNSLNVLSNQVVSVFGGHSRIRISGGKLYFDYFGDEYADPEYGMGTAVTNGQYIEFGKNLLDFTKNYDYTNIATVYFPIGPKLKTKDADGNEVELDERMTIEDATIESGQNGIRKEGVKYLAVDDLYDKYGRIEAKLDISDAETPQQLLEMALESISSTKFNDLTLDVSLVDLHNLDTNIQEYNLLDAVKCLSEPHGLDKIFLITDLKITLDNPAGDTITLNGKGDTSLTSRTVSGLGDVVKKLPKPSSILTQAKINAKKLIDMCTSGYVTFLKDGDHVYAMSITGSPVTKREDLQSLSSYWLWNQNGLGYFSNGETKAAITMEGEIVADFITTGFMHADRIRGGELTLGGFDDVNGLLKIQNGDGDTIGSWDKNGIKAIAGSIGGWNIRDGMIYSNTENDKYIVFNADNSEKYFPNLRYEDDIAVSISYNDFSYIDGVYKFFEDVKYDEKFTFDRRQFIESIYNANSPYFISLNIDGISLYDISIISGGEDCRNSSRYTHSIIRVVQDIVKSSPHFERLTNLDWYDDINELANETVNGVNRQYRVYDIIIPFCIYMSFVNPMDHPTSAYATTFPTKGMAIVPFIFIKKNNSYAESLIGPLCFNSKYELRVELKPVLDSKKFIKFMYIIRVKDSNINVAFGGVYINEDGIFHNPSFINKSYLDSFSRNGFKSKPASMYLRVNHSVGNWYFNNSIYYPRTNYQLNVYEEIPEYATNKICYGYIFNSINFYSYKTANQLSSVLGYDDVLYKGHPLNFGGRFISLPVGIYTGVKSISDLSDFSFKADANGNVELVNAVIRGTSLTGDKSTHAMELADGRLQGYFNGEMTTYISSNATLQIDDGPKIPAMRIVSKGGIAIYGKEILINNEDLPGLGVDGVGARGGTGDINVVTNVWMEGGELKVSYKTLHFVNGIMTTAL